MSFCALNNSVPIISMAWHGENHPPPKRGDTLQFPKTGYIVLGVRRVKRRDPRALALYRCWVFRAGEVDLELYMRLFRSAARAGGAIEHRCTWDRRGGNQRKKTKVTML